MKILPIKLFCKSLHCAQLRSKFISLQLSFRVWTKVESWNKASVESICGISHCPTENHYTTGTGLVDLQYSIHNSANSLLSNRLPVTYGYYLPLERGLGAWNEHYSRCMATLVQMPKCFACSRKINARVMWWKRYTIYNKQHLSHTIKDKTKTCLGNTPYSSKLLLWNIYRLSDCE